MKFKKKSKLAEWQARCADGREFCVRCGDVRRLTVDHIVPVMLIRQLSPGWFEEAYELEENFQVLCAYCNKQKAAELDVKNPKTFSILRKLLDEAEVFYSIKPQKS